MELVQLGFVVLATITSADGTVLTETYEVDVDNSGDLRFGSDMRPLHSLPLDSPRGLLQLMMNIFPSPQNEIVMSAEFEKPKSELFVNVRHTTATVSV